MDALDRTLQPTRRVLGDVDPVQPLDTTHPLLDSVQGFWLPLPRLTGGSRLYDLSKRSHHLSFTFPPTWVQSTDSQYPALSFNATDIVEGPFEPLRSSGSQTLVCTIIRTGSNNADFGNALLHWLGSDRYTLGLDKNEVPFVLTSGGNTLSLNSSTPIPLDTFTTISTSWDQPANDLAVYVNGEPDHKTSNYGDTSSASSPDFVVGKGGGADSLPMVLVGAAAYSTYWPEALHKSWHSQARRGFPDLLRRRDSVGLLGGGGGATIIVPNDVTHDHGIDASTVNVSYGLSPSDTTQGQSIGAAGLNVAYTLSPNALKQGHTLGASALSTGVLLTPNDVQHGHTLDPSSVAVAFTLSPNDAGHTHTLNAGGVNVAYALTPNRLQQGHTLANTGLDTGLVLFPNDVQHGHTLEASSVTVAFTVSPNDSTQGHTLTGSGLDVTYALTPQGVQHAHRIAETGASVAYTLSPSGLLHPQSVGVSGVSVTYVLSPNDAQHEHLLGTPVLIVKGNAERASLEAVPLYQISLSATPIIKDN